MATPLTPVVSRYMNLIAQAHKTVIVIPSVAASDSSPRYEFEIPSKEGRIVQIRAAYPNMTEIDLYVFSSDTGQRDTLEEIVRGENIIKCLQPPPQCVIYENTDPVQTCLLYVEVDNTGTTLPTGEIRLELIISVEGVG